MLIAKACKRGRSASGLFRYLTSGKKDGHLVLLNGGAKEINAPSVQRPDVQKPIAHFVLSLPGKEVLSVHAWGSVTADFISKMGLGNHEWNAIIHNETGHQHVHIVCNRVSWNGEIWLGEFDGKRAIAAAKELEVEYGLAVDEHRPSGRSALTPIEVKRALDTETQPPRLTLQNLIDAAVGPQVTTADFLGRLELQGVAVHPNIASTGKVSGLAFEYGGEIWKGSQLGKAYAWSQLQKRIFYEQDRDHSELQNCARNRARSACQSASSCGRDSSGVRRAGDLDARNDQHDGRCIDENHAAYQYDQRNDKQKRDSAERDKRENGSDSNAAPIYSGKHAQHTNKPSSTLARGRGDVSGSRLRISKLAELLLSRLEIPDASTNDNHRHRSPIATDYREVASNSTRSSEYSLDR